MNARRCRPGSRGGGEPGSPRTKLFGAQHRTCWCPGPLAPPPPGWGTPPPPRVAALCAEGCVVVGKGCGVLVRASGARERGGAARSWLVRASNASEGRASNASEGARNGARSLVG
jgi:hypothetical protein